MGLVREKAYNIYKEDLIAAGFYACDYDPVNDTWIIKRNWYKNATGNKIDKVIKISSTNDKHKYGKDQSSKVISFSTCGRQVSTTLARFIWAWEYGMVCAADQIKHVKPDLMITSFKCISIHDHNDYKKSNQYICVEEIVKEAVKKAIDDYEAGRPVKFDF